jgi:hypothetical protein
VGDACVSQWEGYRSIDGADTKEIKLRPIPVRVLRKDLSNGKRTSGGYGIQVAQSRVQRRALMNVVMLHLGCTARWGAGGEPHRVRYSLIYD